MNENAQRIPPGAVYLRNENDKCVPEGIAPGALYFRTIAEPGRCLLSARSVRLADADVSADQDATLANAWLNEHPDGIVYTFAYDGNTGELIGMCVTTGHAQVYLG